MYTFLLELIVFENDGDDGSPPSSSAPEKPQMNPTNKVPSSPGAPYTVPSSGSVPNDRQQKRQEEAAAAAARRRATTEEKKRRKEELHQAQLAAAAARRNADEEAERDARRLAREEDEKLRRQQEESALRLASEERERKHQEEIAASRLASEEQERKRQEEIAAAIARRMATEEAERKRIASEEQERKRQEAFAANRLASEEQEREQERKRQEAIAAHQRLLYAMEMQSKREKELAEARRIAKEAADIENNQMVLATEEDEVKLRQKAFATAFAETNRIRTDESRKRQEIAAADPFAHENERKKKAEEIAAAALRFATQKEEQQRLQAAEQAKREEEIDPALQLNRRNAKAAAQTHQDAVEEAKRKLSASSPPAGRGIVFVEDEVGAQQTTTGERATSRSRRIAARTLFATDEVKKFFDESNLTVNEGLRRSGRVQAKRQQDPEDAKKAPPQKFLEVSRDDQVGHHSTNTESERGCVCGKTHSTTMGRNLFWILCSRCDKWHHVARSCIGFSKSQAEAMGPWTCPECLKDAERIS
jgi:fused signal recognition particle receptor